MSCMSVVQALLDRRVGYSPVDEVAFIKMGQVGSFTCVRDSSFRKLNLNDV